MKRWGVVILCAVLAACATTVTKSSSPKGAPVIRKFQPQQRGEYPGDAVNRATDQLMLAASQGEMGKIEGLLGEGALIDGWSGATPYLTAVFAAAANGHLDTLRFLLSRGARLDIKAYGVGYTVLHYAAYGGHSDTLAFLLDQGLDADVRDAEGRTALHAAAFAGHEDAARVLLERGADPTIRDKDGRTAADTAAERGHDAVKTMILSHD